MRLVAARTGLSPHVLRVWERRYRVVQPRRTAGGQRVYTDADIARLELLKRAADAGRNIGRLVELSDDALRALVHADQERGRSQGGNDKPDPVPAAGGERSTPSAAILARCFDAVRGLAPEALEAELRRGTILLPLAEFTEQVLAPLLHGMGVLWADGLLGPGAEHAATAVVRRVLDDVIRHCDPAPGAPVIVVGTPAGQRHELGALLAAAAASASGWRVLYLGIDLPASELLHAAAVASARVIALSIVYPVQDERLRAELEAMVTALPPGHILILGGAAAAVYARKLQHSDVHAIPSLAAFRSLLLQLQEHFDPAEGGGG